MAADVLDRRMPPRPTLVVTTYENPRALRLVLVGILRQTAAPCELLIADDGSGEETRETVRRFAEHAPFAVRHLWQPDLGFRKPIILNRAILEAQGDYLVFLDGDCIPPARLIATHLNAARRGRYVTGGKILLSERTSARIDEAAVARGDLERIGGWLLDARRRRRFLASRIPGLRSWLDGNVRRPPGWRGENASAFRDELLAVRGYDERFGYGYEDADLGHRLLAAGVKAVSVRFSAPVYHLDHSRPYAGDAERNKRLFDENRALGITATPFGLPEAQ